MSSDAHPRMAWPIYGLVDGHRLKHLAFALVWLQHSHPKSAHSQLIIHLQDKPDALGAIPNEVRVG